MLTAPAFGATRDIIYQLLAPGASNKCRATYKKIASFEKQIHWWCIQYNGDRKIWLLIFSNSNCSFFKSYELTMSIAIALGQSLGSATYELLINN